VYRCDDHVAYNAFISYSHAADGTLAPALQSALHRFAKPWYKLRALRVFRDQTNLAVNPALWSSICEALDQSQFFILLASPEAAASPWVAKEAEYWITNNGLSHFLIVLTGGDLRWDRSGNCFAPEVGCALPPNLLRSFAEEPLYLDLRWARGAKRLRLREPRFHEAVLQLASTLRHRPKDELDSADIRFQRHTRWLAAAASLALLLAVLTAQRQMGVSKQVGQKNLADTLAARSAKVLADNPDRAREAALLAIESDRLNPSFESNQALRTAAALLPAGAQSYPPEDPSPEERVRDLEFSPDGTKLAVTRDNGSTQLIDVVSRKSLGYFGPDDRPAAQIDVRGDSPGASPDNDSAVSAAFNSTSSQLASGSRDGLVHVWAIDGGRELLRIVHGAPVSQIAFHPKISQLVTATEDGHVRIFDVGGAKLLADFQCPGKIGAASFSPTGDLVAALSEGGVSLFDLANRKLLRTMPSGEAPFTLAFSKDGKRLDAAAGDFAYVWEVAGGRQLLKATHAASSETLIPTRWIVSAAISPDGKFMAYAARGDKLARVWNVDTGRQILELKHDSSVAAVAFNADGTRLGTGSYDGTARVWELPSGREIDRVSHGGGSEVLVFGPGGDRFASSGMDGSVSVSEARRADRPAYFDLADEARSVAFSPDGRRFAIGTRSVHYSPLVKVVETGGNILREIEFQGASVVDKLFFLHPNQLVAQWSNKLFLIKADPPSATPLSDIPGEKLIEPLGGVLAIQRDSVSRLYSLPGLQQTASLDGPDSNAPDKPGSHLLRSADHGRLVAFETTAPPHDFFIDIWSPAAKARVSRVSVPAELNHLAFNPSGTILFTTEGENMQGWDIPSAKRRFALTASGDIDLVIPNPASPSVATSTHGQLTVWDSVSGARLAQLPDNMGYAHSAAFSPDGRYLLAGYQEHSAALWLWRTADLRDQACSRIAHSFSREEWSRWIPEQPYRVTCPNSPPAK
jgi:WD40 repeat protein